MGKGEGQRLWIQTSHWLLPMETEVGASLVSAARLSLRKSPRAAVSWMCLSIVQFPKYEPRSVRSFCPLISYGLFLWKWGERESLNSSEHSTKGTPCGSHFWSHFVYHCPPGPSIVPGTQRGFYKNLSKCGSAPFFSLVPSKPSATMFCYFSKRSSACMALFVVTATVLVQILLAFIYGLCDCIWLVLSLLILLLLNHYRH